MELDIVVEFEKDSYVVNKNEEVKAVIVIEYPIYSVVAQMFPIEIRVNEIDNTATSKSLLAKSLTIKQYVLYVCYYVHTSY